jgi:hypothetical protein
MQKSKNILIYAGSYPKHSFPASTESVPNPIEQAKIVPNAITLPFFIKPPPKYLFHRSPSPLYTYFLNSFNSFS